MARGHPCRGKTARGGYRTGWWFTGKTPGDRTGVSSYPHAVERIIRFAFETARSRPRKLLTVVTKRERAAKRDGIGRGWEPHQGSSVKRQDVGRRHDMPHGAAARVTRHNCRDQPRPNFIPFAAALSGSSDRAPNPEFVQQGKKTRFEPSESAFTHPKKGKAVQCYFWTSAEMLAWLGEKDASQNLLDLVERVCERGVVTADLGGGGQYSRRYKGCH
ncbi:hypothetical protein RRF57_003332 [Xylaria bambusicola]|uniref:Uncharacterized protein n=1 Tax=Xylaria bambusicola TaxID=326684 RepID=A0AAN7Z2P1_9PEZI